VSAGTRAANSLKADLSSMRVVPLFEAVHFPFFTKNINEQHELEVSELSEKAAATMLKELVRWTKGLKAISENKLDT
jgi:hypothetical protein